jgi:ABC-2 type transport system permease protein
VLFGLDLGAGLGYGTPGPILGMTMAYLPACLVFAGVAVGLFGWAPRLAAPITWTLLGVSIALDFLGEFRLVDPAVLLLSPFVRTEAPLVLGSGLPAALLGLTVVALTLGGAGLVGLRRRDLNGR